MSEPQTIETPKPAPLPPPAPSARGGAFGMAFIIALLALGVSGWQFYTSQQELLAVRGELAKELTRGSGAASELRALTEKAISANHATEGRLAVMEGRINEFAGQYATLNGMYQELTKNRSDWLLSEVEYTLAIASQQLQLAGNISAGISALEMIDARLSKFDQPQLIALKKAVATDLETLKALPYVDNVDLTIKLDRLMLSAESLPLVIDAHRLPQTKVALASKRSASMPAWQQFLSEMTQSLGELVRIRRMDKPEALLLSPEQAFFLRENLKMRLLSARLALLQRDATTFKTDTFSARSYVQRYFDDEAPATKQWLNTLSELENIQLKIDIPNLNNSLKAVRDAQGLAGE